MRSDLASSQTCNEPIQHNILSESGKSINTLDLSLQRDDWYYAITLQAWTQDSDRSVEKVHLVLGS